YMGDKNEHSFEPDKNEHSFEPDKNEHSFEPDKNELSFAFPSPTYRNRRSDVLQNGCFSDDEIFP
ncbi:hypothetical protein AVEN_137433-1, partial [Araneus ventricosus]